MTQQNIKIEASQRFKRHIDNNLRISVDLLMRDLILKDPKYIANYRILGILAIILLLTSLLLPEGVFPSSKIISWQWGGLGYQIKIFALFFGITFLIVALMEYWNFKFFKTKRNWISILHIYGSITSLIGVYLSLILSHNDIAPRRYYRIGEFGEFSNYDFSNSLMTICFMIFVVLQTIFLIEFCINAIRFKIQRDKTNL